MTGDSDKTALFDALTNAASYGVRDGRECHLNSAADGLKFVCDHISGTILERRLTFFFDGAPRLTCDAKGGRLLGFAVFDRSGAATDDGAFDDPSDAGKTGAMLGTLRDTIASLCDGADTIAVQVQGLATGPDGEHGGVPPEAIAAAFGLGTQSSPPMETFQRFLASAAAHISAAACLEDDMLHPLSGDDAMTEQLVAALEDTLSDVEALPGGLAGALSQDAMICWSDDSAAGQDMLAATLGGQVFFALVAPASLPALSRHWHHAQS